MAKQMLFTSDLARDDIIQKALAKMEKDIKLVQSELPKTGDMYAQLISEEVVGALIEARESAETSTKRMEVESSTLGDGWVKLRSLNPKEMFTNTTSEKFAPESEMNAKYGHVLDYGLFGNIFNNLREPDLMGRISDYFKDVEKKPAVRGNIAKVSLSKEPIIQDLQRKIQASINKDGKIKKTLDLAVTNYIRVLSSIFAVSHILEKMNAVLLVDTSFQPEKSSLKWDLFKYISAEIWSEIDETVLLESLDKYISSGNISGGASLFEISLYKQKGNPKFYNTIKSGSKEKFVLYTAGYRVKLPSAKSFSLDDINLGRSLYKRSDIVFGDDEGRRKFFYAFMHQLAQRKGQVEYHAVNLFRRENYVYPNLKKK